mmetsp:Transcript_15450/g.25251  ORF Transcript_15450/g.25251 Transcript_15450/m.25251 type:complete len:222 (+) Transcript_15450:830-1495(+)
MTLKSARLLKASTAITISGSFKSTLIIPFGAHSAIYPANALIKASRSSAEHARLFILIANVLFSISLLNTLLITGFALSRISGILLAPAQAWTGNTFIAEGHLLPFNLASLIMRLATSTGSISKDFLSLNNSSPPQDPVSTVSRILSSFFTAAISSSRDLDTSPPSRASPSSISNIDSTCSFIHSSIRPRTGVSRETKHVTINPLEPFMLVISTFPFFHAF